MNNAKVIAFGGVFAALAVVIMCICGIIPFMTYVSPLICICMLQLIYRVCGKNAAWSWYGAVSILSLLLCPDKEAAAVFTALGYYPIVKQFIDQFPFKLLFKVFYFSGAILFLYWLLIGVMGMEQLADEFSELGKIMTAVMMLLGNVIFLILDKILERMNRKMK